MVGGPQTLVAIPLTVVLVVLAAVDTVLASIALGELLIVVVLPDTAPVSELAEAVTLAGEEEVWETGSRLGGPKVVDSVRVLMLTTMVPKELGGVLGAPYGRSHGPAPSPNSRQWLGFAGTIPDIVENGAGVVVVIETAGRVVVEDPMLSLRASTEKMLVPAAAAERTVEPVVLLGTVVVMSVCKVTSAVPLRISDQPCVGIMVSRAWTYEVVVDT